ncbi:MAG: hypothetical protein WC856_22670 [Methylococcaceae bacterium]|jgi:hypothetical protein
MKKIIALMIVLFANSGTAADLYDPQSGKYLGRLGGSQYDANSTNNPYGQYGSKYSADSINNPYGKYGSQYSNSSPNNPYATQAPVIIDNGYRR